MDRLKSRLLEDEEDSHSRRVETSFRPEEIGAGLSFHWKDTRTKAGYQGRGVAASVEV